MIFFLQPPRSSCKKLFLGTRLGEKLQAISSAKAFPKGLKWIEYECGIGGKNPPIHYIPKQDPVQDALKKNKRTMYFKLMPPHTRIKLKVAIWVSGTPKLFLIHVRGVIHVVKEMELDVKLQEATQTLESTNIDLDIAKATFKVM